MLKNIIPARLKKIILKYKNREIRDVYKKQVIRKFSSTENQQRLLVIGTPNFGNLGDHAISEGEIKFLKDNFKDCEIIEFSFLEYTHAKETVSSMARESDIIFIHGGGFLGTLWLLAENMVRDIIVKFPKNKIIIFPQSIYFENDQLHELDNTKRIFGKHSDLTIFARDKRSFDFAMENYPSNNVIKFVPDIVTYLDFSEYGFQRKDFLFCLRTDKEKVDNPEIKQLFEILESKGYNCSITDTVVDANFEGEIRKKYLESKFKEFAASQLVVTDRLHGMIFSLITGTPCIAFDNVSKKVSGVYEWFEDTGYIICINEDNKYLLDNPEKLINQLIENSKNGYYSNQEMIEKLEPLRTTIENAITENE